MQERYLLVGGNSATGSAVIQKLNERGAEIFITSRTAISDLPAGAQAFQADVLHEEIPAEAIPEVLDGLVYLPGSINLRPFRALKPENFREDLEINLIGAVKAIQSAQKSLKKSGRAAIVLFSSVAVQTGMPFHASTAAAKGAVEGLVRSLAAEMAPEIRVNAIAPSLTRTRMAERLLSSTEKEQAAAKRHALQRVGAPEDLAAAVLFLLTEQSAWMTGQILGVDGGMGTLKG